MITFCAATGQESMAAICGVKVPKTVGVPVIVPPGEIARPLGNREPIHATGAKPPVETSWKLYEAFCVPVGRVCVVIASGVQLIVSENWRAVVFERLSVTWTVKVYTPAVVGVPVSAPVVLFRRTLGGSVPRTTAKVYGVLPPATARL